jgi:hypothetical protein
MRIRGFLTLLSSFGLAGLLLATTPAGAEAQFGRRLKDAVKRTAEDKAIQKTTETESKAIDDALSSQGAKEAAADSAGPAAVKDTTRGAGAPIDSAEATRRAGAAMDSATAKRPSKPGK